MRDDQDHESRIEPETATADARPRRVAVVFIHGQGQQKPMEDVEKLARTVWKCDQRIRPNGEDVAPELWTVPDPGSHRATADESTLADSGRVTTHGADNITDENGAPLRVDFIEFYWAHLMEGNRLGHLMRWFIDLQQRPRGRVPRRLLSARQWIIRPVESLVLVALLFSLLTSMLLRQDGAAPIGQDVAWYALPFTQSGGAALVSLLAILAVLAGAVAMIWNEATGGRADPDKKAARTRKKHEATPEKALRAQRRASRGALWTFYAAVGVAIAAIPVILVTIAGRGPGADWSDMSFMISLLTLLGGAIFAARKVIKALWVALAAAALSGAATLSRDSIAPGLLFSDDVRQHVSRFEPGEQVTAFGRWVSSALSTFARFMETPENACIREVPDRCMQAVLSDVQVILPGLLILLACFAVLWTIIGLKGSVAAPRTPWMRTVWSFLILAVSGGIALGVWSAMQDAPFQALHGALGVVLGLLLVFGGFVFVIARDNFLVPVMADSARYFSKDPDNVAARNRVRAAGVKLLKRLHEAEYDRIVVVAHSLGTVIGYELLADYWSRATLGLSFSHEDDVCRKVEDVEQATVELEQAAEYFIERHPGALERLNAARAVFRNSQRQLSEALRRKTARDVLGAPWKISDFVTLGTPLTHASLLMATSPADLMESFQTRRHSACPPCGEHEGDISAIRFAKGDLMKAQEYRFTHSSVFAAVRWSNLYFDMGPVFAAGDVIGGPLNYVEAVDGDEVGFGEGIHDMSLDYRETGKLFAHNEYWKSDIDVDTLRTLLKDGKPIYIGALISALNLREGLPS